MSSDWWIDAACKDQPPELWFPESGYSHEPAKQVCNGCPVRQECLDYAIKNGEPSGIWGGKDADERRKLRRKQLKDTRETRRYAVSADRAPRYRIELPKARHGTRAGYTGGCRCLECTEAERIYSAIRWEREHADA